MALAVKESGHLFAGDLFFIERAQNQSGGAVVFEFFHRVEIVSQRAAAPMISGCGKVIPR